MFTIHQLLEDPKYRAFFQTQPKLAIRGRGKPWRVYIMTEDMRWKKKDFALYTEAFKFFRRKLKAGEVVDGTIHCLRQSYAPPVRLARIRGKFIVGSDGVRRQATKRVEWKPRLTALDFEDYTWCPWCRRPTIFRHYRTHHSLKMPIDPTVPRCHICGASDRVISYTKAV